MANGARNAGGPGRLFHGRLVLGLRDRPCLEWCNRRGCEPTKCLGRIVYSDDDPRKYLGRGYADVAGRPFGWAHNQEREAIRRHLRRRLWRFGLDDLRAARLEQRVTQIQRRLHREKPTMKERQARIKTVGLPSSDFTADELRHIVDAWQFANDPLSAAIAVKAAAKLASGEN